MNLNRRMTTTLILGIVAIALVLVAVFALGGGEEDETAEATEEGESAIPEPLFPDEQMDAVSSVTVVENETGRRFAASLDVQSLAWQIDEVPEDVAQEGMEADTATINVAASSLTSLTPIRDLGELEALATYGLDNPRYNLTFTTTSGVTHELLLGSENPGGAGIYARVDSRDGVYILPAFAVEQLIGFLDAPPYAQPTLEPTGEATQEG